MRSVHFKMIMHSKNIKNKIEENTNQNSNEIIDKLYTRKACNQKDKI